MHKALNIALNSIGIFHANEAIHGHGGALVVIALQKENIVFQIHAPKGIIVLTQSIYSLLQAFRLQAQLFPRQKQILRLLFQLMDTIIFIGDILINTHRHICELAVFRTDNMQLQLIHINLAIGATQLYHSTSFTLPKKYCLMSTDIFLGRLSIH